MQYTSLSAYLECPLISLTACFAGNVYLPTSGLFEWFVVIFVGVFFLFFLFVLLFGGCFFVFVLVLLFLYFYIFFIVVLVGWGGG